MTTLTTSNFKIFNIDNFINSFSNNSFYLFTGFAIPYTQDNTPPVIGDCPRDVTLDVHDYMINGKRLTSTDVVKMIKRYDWSAGTVYEEYSHDNPSLLDSKFFVIVNEGSTYSVFKCLSNNGGVPSTSSPTIASTSPADDIYNTVDGYQWKFMYGLSDANFNKFATDTYIPVYANTQVTGNAISGSIDNIKIMDSGDSYASYTSGTFQTIFFNNDTTKFKIESSSSSNTNFYTTSALKVVSGTGAGQQRTITAYDGINRVVTIDSEFDTVPTTASGYSISPLVTIAGDGTGAVARALVNATTNSISSIEINSRGSGYTYGSALVSGNTGTIGVSSANVKVIISPQGGHGSNVDSELGARYLGMSTVFSSILSVGKVIDENDFRSIGLIQNPLFSNVEITITSATGTFVVDEEVVLYERVPVADIVVTNPGSGYISNAVVTVTNGTTGGTGLAANAEANTSGKITTINVTAHGNGYLFAPSVTVAPPANQSFNALTAVSNTNDFITITSNVFKDNDLITYYAATGNTAVSGLTNATSFYVVSSNSSGVKLSSTLNGSAINLTAGTSETGHILKGNTATVTPVLNYTDTALATGTVVSANLTNVKLKNVQGFFVEDVYIYGKTVGHSAFADVVTQPDAYFDQTLKISGSPTSGTFIEDEPVIQATTNAHGRVYFANSSVMRLVNTEGSFSSTGLITGQTSAAQWTPSGNSTTVMPSDVVRDNGNVLYVENFSPITKSASQTETFKLIFEF